MILKIFPTGKTLRQKNRTRRRRNCVSRINIPTTFDEMMMMMMIKTHLVGVFSSSSARKISSSLLRVDVLKRYGEIRKIFERSLTSEGW